MEISRLLQFMSSQPEPFAAAAQLNQVCSLLNFLVILIDPFLFSDLIFIC